MTSCATGRLVKWASEHPKRSWKLESFRDIQYVSIMLSSWEPDYKFVYGHVSRHSLVEATFDILDFEVSKLIDYLKPREVSV